MESGRIVEFNAELRDLHPDTAPAHPLSPPGEDLERADREPLWRGHWSRRRGRSRPGVRGGVATRRWAHDTVRLAADADIGVYNPGGLRADIVEGPLTRARSTTSSPFGNAVVSFEVSGDQLVGLLLKNASAELAQDHPVMQLGGHGDLEGTRRSSGSGRD